VVLTRPCESPSDPRRRTTPRGSPLAARTFRDTFGEFNRPEDIALHEAETYGADLQRAEIEDPRTRTLLAEADGGALAGYAQLHASDAPACVSGAAPVELARFYVDRPWHGRGVAQALLAAALAEARALGGATLWLGVWEKNARAKAFYRKHGFEERGSKVYRVGQDPQTDHVMEVPLTGASGGLASAGHTIPGH